VKNVSFALELIALWQQILDCVEVFLENKTCCNIGH